MQEFESNEPQLEWFNQLNVTIAMGKLYEQKGDLEKAVHCYETVLSYTPKDTKTLIKLSKCYQKLLQPEQAIPHQNHAMQNDPSLFQTAENEASLNFELGNYEKSLIAYHTFFERLRTSSDCQRGLIKVNEVMENHLPVKGLIKSLRSNILEMIESNQFFSDESTPCRMIDKEIKSNTFHSKRQAQEELYEESHYLRNIIENIKYYRKQLNVLPRFRKNDEIIYENIQKVILTFEKTKEILCRQDPFYMVLSRRSRLKSSNGPKKIKKDMIKLQVAKYVNTIVTHCLAGRIMPATKQAELAMNYMETQWYKPFEIVNKLFEVLGLAISLVNRDIAKWSDELNDKRIQFILGSNVDNNDAYNNSFHQSYFGPHNPNTGSTVKQLLKRLRKNELSTYTVYLQYELIKCYLEQNEFKKASQLSTVMFSVASNLGSTAWQVNASMMTAISESRLGNALKCMKVLELTIPLSITMGNEKITQFLRKTLNLIAEEKVQVHMVSLEEKRKADMIYIMPDSMGAHLMRDTLYRIEKLPPESRMPMLLGECAEINCKVFKRQAWRKHHSKDKLC